MATINVSRKRTLTEQVYLIAVLQGMWTTIKYFFRGLTGYHRTVLYPEKKRNYSDRFRGRHYISVDDNKTENCTACYLCQTVCPAECITIIAEERDPEHNQYGVKKEKRPLSFDVDALRCCFCGMCEEACPKDAIKLSRDYELAELTREETVYDLKQLTRDIKGRGGVKNEVFGKW